MSLSLFNIGLAFLSIKATRKTLREESRRILSQFEGRTVAEGDISRENGGRPYFSNDNNLADFNISHSGNVLAVSYVKSNESKIRTGCDIQLVKYRKNTLKIAEHFFSSSECEYVLSQNKKGNDAAFFEIWALKECYIKLRGLSVFDMAGVPGFCVSSGCFDCEDALSFYLYKLKDNAGSQYILAAANEGISSGPSIKWYSDSSLPCEYIAKIIPG